MKSALITRYNLEYGSLTRGEHLDPGWLSHRLELFSCYTAHSIASLTVKPDVWLILVHPDTPAERKREILGAASASGIARVRGLHPGPPERDLAARQALAAEIQKLLGTSGPVVTTRLDNDDALAPWFYQKLFSLDLAPGFAFNFWFGSLLVKDTKEVLEFGLPANPFISLVENLRDLKTVFHKEHTHLREDFEVVEVETKEVMWIQTVHDRNLVNCVPWRVEGR